MKDGLLLIDKHKGCTSHDVVASARRILRQKKIGHCGTLDPAATGLLLLTVGRATRLTRFLIKAPKVYEGEARFGITTDTYDTTGQTVAEGDPSQLTAESIAAAMEPFVGTYMQTPPPYSAKKVNGVKYYELARKGEETPDVQKPVNVYEYHLAQPWQSGEDARFILGCESGTYARSLVHDLGQALGCGAALASLYRSQIGNFSVDDAINLEALRERVEAEEDVGSSWIPFDDIPLPFGEVIADAQQENRIQHGQTVLIRNLESQEGDWVKVINQRQRFIAVGSVTERIGTANVGVVQPKVVFH